MLPDELLRQLRDLLADLYTAEESARRIVADAGMDERYIKFSERAIDNWHEILQEAQKQPAQVEQLLQTAQGEYPENLPLQAAYAVYRQWAAQQLIDLEDRLNAYLHQIVQATSSLLLPELAHHQDAQPSVVRLELTEIYTALETRHLLESNEAAEEAPAQRQSVLGFVNHCHYSVILGDPGSGKTTFANFLALCLAGARLRLADINLTRLGGEWSHGALWPIHIPARSLIAALKTEKQAQPDLLWNHVVARVGLQPDGFAASFAQRLTADGGIVIIDGFDEIPTEQQRRLNLMLIVQTFRQRFPNVRILLTSRTYTYPTIQAALPDFASAVLAPFSPTQITTFIQQWYRPAVAPVQPGLNLQTQADLLRQLLRQYPALHELAGQPLLLTLLTTLHALRPTALPTDQVQIFEESIEWLLVVWERSKAQPDTQSWLQLSLRQLRAVIEQLAYTAQARQSPLPDMADIAESEWVDALLNATRDPDLRPRRVIAYIRDRTGLLSERSPRLYSFPHRAMQEYLAACHLLAKEGATQELLGLVQQAPERWREVVLWAGRKRAATEPATIWPLVGQLCAAGSAAPAGQVAGRLILLAGCVLAEARIKKNDLTTGEQLALWTQVRHGLLSLLTSGQLSAPERLTAGAIMGQMGDPRPGIGLDLVRHLPALDWIEIAPGPFLIGSEPPYTHCSWIDQPYQISRYPITVAQYQTFIAAGGYTQRQWWTGAGWSWRRAAQVNAPQSYEAIFQTPNHPQVGLSWYEAVAFCRWLSAQLGQKIELPNEFQWERAARHLDGRTYPWGNEFAAQHCNTLHTGLSATSAVGIFPSGNAACGAADLAGNVWEWCRTTWYSQLADYTPAADLDLEDAVRRALRGGSFGNAQRFVRCANRHRNYPDHRAHNVGFRVVLSGSVA